MTQQNFYHNRLHKSNEYFDFEPTINKIQNENNSIIEIQIRMKLCCFDYGIILCVSIADKTNITDCDRSLPPALDFRLVT